MRGLDPRSHHFGKNAFVSGWIAGPSGAKTRFALSPGNDG
jgi:hypothetical protein